MIELEKDNEAMTNQDKESINALIKTFSHIEKSKLKDIKFLLILSYLYTLAHAGSIIYYHTTGLFEIGGGFIIAMSLFLNADNIANFIAKFNYKSIIPNLKNLFSSDRIRNKILMHATNTTSNTDKLIKVNTDIFTQLNLVKFNLSNIPKNHFSTINNSAFIELFTHTVKLEQMIQDIGGHDFWNTDIDEVVNIMKKSNKE